MNAVAATRPYEPDMNNADLADARDQVIAMSTADLMTYAASILRGKALSTAARMNSEEFDVMGTADAARSVVWMRTMADELDRRAVDAGSET